MPETKNNIELRSNDVQEIMSHVPSWMIRWGITLIFVLIALGIFTTWFIKYPDIISGNATLSTEQPVIKLVVKNSGEIDNLFFAEKATVNKGDVIASLVNSIDEPSKRYLEILCSYMRIAINSDKPSIQFNDENLSFGTLQSAYNELKSTYFAYKYFRENNSAVFEIQTLREQMNNYSNLRSVISKQLQTAERQLVSAKEKWESDQRLYDKGVISKTQLIEEQKKLIQSENEVNGMKKESVQISITITDLKKQLREIEDADKKELNDYLVLIDNQLSSIENSLQNWESNFEVKALIDGTLAYLEPLSKNMYVESGTNLFAIVPDNREYIGSITVPLQGYGKLEIGQTVKIKLDNYPYQEYGQLTGKITSISLIPTEQNYRVEFALTNGLKSSYGRTFEYTPEMSGKAEIITEDIRLMERIFNKFRKIIN